MPLLSYRRLEVDIFAQGWTSGTSPGSTASYTVYVANPDPGG
jgi:hypothetical protein